MTTNCKICTMVFVDTRPRCPACGTVPGSVGTVVAVGVDRVQQNVVSFRVGNNTVIDSRKVDPRQRLCSDV